MKKNTGKALALLAALALLLAGCGGGGKAEAPEDHNGYGGSETMAASEIDTVTSNFRKDSSPAEAEQNGGSLIEYEAPSQQENPAEYGRKLIKTMSFSIETQEFDKSTAAVSALVNLLGGYIEDASISGSSYKKNDSRTARYVLRIPVSALAEFDSKVGDIGNITSRAENVRDITLDYTDTESRLKSLETQRDTLIGLMEKAESLDDLLTIQDHLSYVEYELERYASQLRLYDNQVEYSSITISLNEVRVYTEPVETPVTFSERISAAFKRGLKSIGDFFKNLALFLAEHLIGLGLIGLFIAAVVMLIKKTIKKQRAGKAAACAAQRAQKTQNEEESGSAN